MIKNIIIGALSGGLVGVLLLPYLREQKPPPDNPFIKRGVLATRNGVVAEVFSFEDCYILVTTVPNEPSRGMFQMECP